MPAVAHFPVLPLSNIPGYHLAGLAQSKVIYPLGFQSKFQRRKRTIEAEKDGKSGKK